MIPEHIIKSVGSTSLRKMGRERVEKICQEVLAHPEMDERKIVAHLKRVGLLAKTTYWLDVHCVENIRKAVALPEPAKKSPMKVVWFKVACWADDAERTAKALHDAVGGDVGLYTFGCDYRDANKDELAEVMSQVPPDKLERVES